MNEYEQWGREMARKCFWKLDRLVERKWGHGGKVRLEKELDHGAGWFKSHRRRGQITLVNLLAALRALDERPEEFFAEVEGDQEPPSDDLGAEEPLADDLPPVAKIALERHASLCGDDHHHAEMSLGSLDEARYTDPIGTIRALSGLVPQLCSVEEIARTVAVAGSCYRLVDQARIAVRCLETAMSIGEGLDLTRGDIFQRLSSCYNKLNPRRAIRFAEKASLIYIKRFDLRKMGETQVDLANSYYALGDADQSGQLLRGALEYLPHLGARNKAAVYQGLAMAAGRRGLQSEAVEWLSKAEASSGTLSNPWLLAHVYWARGLILKDYLSFADASRILANHSPYEAICCFLDMASSIQNTALLRELALQQIDLMPDEPFAQRFFENLISRVDLPKEIDLPRERIRVKNWRARSLKRDLARLDQLN